MTDKIGATNRWSAARYAANRRRRVDQLWNFVDRSAGIDACWPWRGRVDHSGRGRYGRADIDGVTRTAHRLIYLLAGFPIPPNWEVDHLCRNRLCCNPRHLEAVPRDENRRRAGGVFLRRPKCLRGHVLVGANLYVRPGPRREGRRACRECNRERDRRRRMVRRG
jgi:hypothetical protein